MKISYGITVHNEADELNKLLEILVHKTDKEDEIVVCVDGDDEKVEAVLGEFLSEHKAIVYKRKLEKDFSAQKNSVIEKSGGDYIFHIDADEYPDPDLVATLPWILQENPDTEVYWVPRINIVNGIRAEHLQQWGWRMDADNRINFPDYQCRILKNVDRIKWMNKVHEIIIGQTTEAKLPTNDMYCLQHPKTIDRQEEQNSFYNTL